MITRYAPLQAADIEECVQIKADEGTWGGCLACDLINRKNNGALISVDCDLVPFVIRQVVFKDHCMFPRDAFRAAKVDSKSNAIKRKNSIK